MIKYSIDLSESTIELIAKTLEAQMTEQQNIKELREAINELVPQYKEMHKIVYGR